MGGVIGNKVIRHLGRLESSNDSRNWEEWRLMDEIVEIIRVCMNMKRINKVEQCSSS